ncbi:MAG: tRNA pseudouridine(38-40) synthase TruA [Planctomycetes bacterium]|jgi:tRNA pseudouridine38-40 synthase|nr:tRNA pseudouridine(38-40) synthase TruA [Planctomycetota bacterium]
MQRQRPPRNLKLVIAYNGQAYHGWQRQAAGIDTVQERIEAVATRILGHSLTAHGAGRTDAGVHAEGQVASIPTTNTRVPCKGMRRAMNARLPADITVRSVTDVDPDFQASLSSVGKTYRYCIHAGPQRPAERAGQVWHYGRPLDIERMQEAATRIVGEHDFAGFATSGDARLTTVRTVYRCAVSEDGPLIHITVQGSGFLYNMVRNIVGTLVEIARGHWGPERVDAILAAADRALAGPTAPPEGLSMICVHYDPNEFV